MCYGKGSLKRLQTRRTTLCVMPLKKINDFKIMGVFHYLTVTMLITNLCQLRLDGWERM